MKHKLLGSLGPFLLVAVLSGCGNQETTISYDDIIKASNACKAHSGVKYFVIETATFHEFRIQYVRCNDNAYFQRPLLLK